MKKIYSKPQVEFVVADTFGQMLAGSNGTTKRGNSIVTLGGGADGTSNSQESGDGTIGDDTDFVLHSKSQNAWTAWDD